MSNTKMIYDTSCRFTDADVVVSHHGHGLRIALGSDNDNLTSRFLNAAQANALTDALVRAGFGSATAEASLAAALRIEELEATIAADGLREGEMAKRIEELEAAIAAADAIIDDQATRIAELEGEPSGDVEFDAVWEAITALRDEIAEVYGAHNDLADEHDALIDRLRAV
jgi:hypothetical protein